MKFRHHIILALLTAVFCAPCNGTEKVTLRPIQPSASKISPYSAGFMLQGGKVSSSYETTSHDIPLDGFRLGAGCYTRVYFHRSKPHNPLCYAEAEVMYSYKRFSEMSRVQEKIATAGCHYISPTVSLGADLMSIMGLSLGLGGDFLVGYHGDKQSIVYGTINKECLNKFIPKLVVGFKFMDSLISVNLEIPLNSGIINLDRYTYYNRSNISHDQSFDVIIRLQFRALGSSHR